MCANLPKYILAFTILGHFKTILNNIIYKSWKVQSYTSTRSASWPKPNTEYRKQLAEYRIAEYNIVVKLPVTWLWQTLIYAIWTLMPASHNVGLSLNKYVGLEMRDCPTSGHPVPWEEPLVTLPQIHASPFIGFTHSQMGRGERTLTLQFKLKHGKQPPHCHLVDESVITTITEISKKIDILK